MDPSLGNEKGGKMDWKEYEIESGIEKTGVYYGPQQLSVLYSPGPVQGIHSQKQIAAKQNKDI